MEKVSIEWSENKNTSQIYSSGVELALCSDDNKQIGTFVLCKDFFQDAILAFIHDQKCQIYGYHYDPKTMPAIPQHNLKVLIGNVGDEGFPKKVINIPDFVNQIEEKLNLEKTIINECENPPKKYEKSGVYLLTADKSWTHAPPLLSLWTLMVRNGINHEKGNKTEDTIDGIINGKIKPAQKNDHIYLTHGKPGLDLILQKGIKAVFGEEKKKNYPKDKAGTIMHHYSGIVAHGSKKAQKHFPDWLHPEIDTNPPSCCFS